MTSNKWKSRTLLVGTAIGAISGLAAAYILIQKSEKAQTEPSLSPGDGVKIGLGVLSVLKLLSDPSNK